MKNMDKWLLTSLVLMIPFISWGNPPWLSGVFILLLAGAFLNRLWRIKKGENISAPPSLLWLPLFILLVFSIFHLAISPVPYSSLTFTVQLAAAGIFLYLILSQKTAIRPRTVSLLWVATILPWISIQFFSGKQLPRGPFLNPNYTATVLLCCLALLLGSLLPDRGSKKETAIMLAASVGCTGGLMMIGSRSAGLGMILLWAAFMVFKKGSTRWTAILVVAAVLLVPNTIRYRVTEGYKEDPHAFSRIQIWKVALNMGLDHPLAGAGPRIFYDRSPVYAFPTEELPVRYGRIARKPHSEYLRAWAEGGAVGVLTAILLLGAALWIMMRGWRHGRAGPVLATAVILYQAMFHDLSEVYALVVLVVWMLGQLENDASRPVYDGDRQSGIVLTAAGVMVVCLALWINADLVSRALWQKGVMVTDQDAYEARSLYENALKVNPLLPGAARELAQVNRILAKQQPNPSSWEHTEASIKLARRLNMLDTVPLRLWAALYRDIAATGGHNLTRALGVAEVKLREALLLEPHNALIWLNLSEVLWEMGNYDGAYDAVARALDKEPNYMDAHRTKLAYLIQLDPDAVNAAKEDLEIAEARGAGYRPNSRYEDLILR